MANVVSAFFQRLTAAADDYNKAKVGELAALDAVYLDLKPEVASIGQTIRLYFPDVGAYVDQAANDWIPEDINTAYIDVPFGQRPGKALLIRDFEQWLTSTDILTQYLDPMYKRAMEYANLQIFSQVTAGNFNIYPAITTTPEELDVGSARLCWNTLIRNKVPIRGPADSSVLYHPDVHANTLTDPAWYQENIVGELIAMDTRQNVAMGGANDAFRFKRRSDVQALTGTSAALAGTVTLTSGSTAVLGVTSTFTQQIAAPPTTNPPSPGNTVWLTFGAETVSYPVKSVTDDTHLTLATPYTGVLTSGAAYARTTYTGVAMHRYAMALAVRPLELVNTDGVTSRMITLGPIGFPVRVMLSYQHPKGGWMLSMDYGMVARVIRPDFGVLFTS
jgi:hypothetical protein